MSPRGVPSFKSLNLQLVASNSPFSVPGTVTKVRSLAGLVGDDYETIGKFARSVDDTTVVTVVTPGLPRGE